MTLAFRTEDSAREPLTDLDDGLVRVRGWIVGRPDEIDRLLDDRRARLRIVSPSGNYSSGSMSN